MFDTDLEFYVLCGFIVCFTHVYLTLIEMSETVHVTLLQSSSLSKMTLKTTYSKLQCNKWMDGRMRLLTADRQC